MNDKTKLNVACSNASVNKKCWNNGRWYKFVCWSLWMHVCKSTILKPFLSHSLDISSSTFFFFLYFATAVRWNDSFCCALWKIQYIPNTDDNLFIHCDRFCCRCRRRHTHTHTHLHFSLTAYSHLTVQFSSCSFEQITTSRSLCLVLMNVLYNFLCAVKSKLYEY